MDGSHDRANFDCGEAALNDWLKNSARQQAAKNTARTFVASPSNPTEWRAAGFTDVTENTILGYFTLASGQAEGHQLPTAAAKKLPRTVPITRLARLAIDERFQGQGLGEALLAEAVRRTLVAAEQIGIAGLFVDAKPGAISFYAKYGFTACTDDPSKLWLALPAARR